MTDREFLDVVLDRHESAARAVLRSEDELSSTGDLHIFEPGLIALRGSVLGLYRWFETRFKQLALQFDAKDHHCPVMVPISVLEEVRYFHNFPQHVVLCSHLPEDLHLLEDIAKAADGDDGAHRTMVLQGLAPSRHALKPAVCLPCYPMYRDSVVSDDGFCLTVQNHVFRHETKGFDAMARLWDFQVRDIVFFGGYERLIRLREEVMQATMRICKELDLTARLEVANDPFFLKENRSKIVYQRLGQVKYELLLSVPHRQQDIAASSFNIHRDFYTAVYNIQLNAGVFAETACMGFGIERWVYAFLSQHGVDMERWPNAVRGWILSGERAQA